MENYRACSRCGAAVKRLNMYRGQALCDECYEKVASDSDLLCSH